MALVPGMNIRHPFFARRPPRSAWRLDLGAACAPSIARAIAGDIAEAAAVGTLIAGGDRGAHAFENERAAREGELEGRARMSERDGGPRCARA